MYKDLGLAVEAYHVNKNIMANSFSHILILNTKNVYFHNRSNNVDLSYCFAGLLNDVKSKERMHTIKLTTSRRPTANRKSTKNFASHLSNFLYNF